MTYVELEKDLAVQTTNIEGVYVIDLTLHGDNRGWFKENYQKAKMEALGLPSFKIVQNNMSYNAKRGVTRGIHAEPWSKYISIAKGRVFEALVDLRAGSATYGEVFTKILDEGEALFVPDGVGNAFQSLEDDTVYTYLVTAHWSAELKSSYTFVNAADPDLNIQWPIPLEESERSAADLLHPSFKDVVPYAGKRTLVIGALGQLGSAIKEIVEKKGIRSFDFVDRDSLDLTDETSLFAWPWTNYKAIINCAAYTAVDAAEAPENQSLCWDLNAKAPKNLSLIASKYDLELIHISSEYVFDGLKTPHTEDESFAPLGVYGQSKAAGDLAVACTPRHYILRTSWLIGSGKNFARTMFALSNRVADPADSLNEVAVVDDQIGRLTFANRLAECIFHILDTHPAYGTYNVSGAGSAASWFEVAKFIFDHVNNNGDKLKAISSEEYKENMAPESAKRPKNSLMSLDKIEATSYVPVDWKLDLLAYLDSLAM